MSKKNILRASDGLGETLKVTPEIAGWKHLSFSVQNHGMDPAFKWFEMAWKQRLFLFLV
ncbi:MAG: hypothetical protein ACRBHB_07415 [Arenicella sp.]